jgi:hypothetical protein
MQGKRRLHPCAAYSIFPPLPAVKAKSFRLAGLMQVSTQFAAMSKLKLTTKESSHEPL